METAENEARLPKTVGNGYGAVKEQLTRIGRLRAVWPRRREAQWRYDAVEAGGVDGAVECVQKLETAVPRWQRWPAAAGTRRDGFGGCTEDGEGTKKYSAGQRAAKAVAAATCFIVVNGSPESNLMDLISSYLGDLISR